MTVEAATQRLRRCAECGRFLSSDAIDGLCTSCGETVHTAAADTTSNVTSNDTSNDTPHDTPHDTPQDTPQDTANSTSAAGPNTNGTIAAPTTRGTIADRKTSGISADPTTSGTSPAAADVSDAVAIPIDAPIANVAPSRGASASLSTSAVRPRGVVILRPSQLHPDAPAAIAAKTPIEPVARPRAAEILPLPAFEPLPQPVSVPDHADDTDDWTIRIVVGVIIGILVGIAVPFLLSQ